MATRSQTRPLAKQHDEWIAAGVFETISNEAISGYDRIIGLDLSDVAVDSSLHKSLWRRGNG